MSTLTKGIRKKINFPLSIALKFLEGFALTGLFIDPQLFCQGPPGLQASAVKSIIITI